MSVNEDVSNNPNAKKW